ncbi:MAG: hypothetical protein WCJ73_07495 [Actinomycetes bacterium]
MGKLDGNVAIVTGGPPGHGAADSFSLAGEGTKVVACDVLGEEGAAVATQIGDALRQ